jgi:type VI secretion system protein VasD
MRKFNGELLLLLTCFFISGLSGCGVMGFGMAKVNLQPSKLMNVSDDGNPLPTVVWIYQLKSKNKMEQANFMAIWRNDKEILDDDLLEKKEVTIYPGKAQDIETKKKDGAGYIAIVAIFRNPDEDTNKWKQIFELASWSVGSQKINVIIAENSLKVGILKESESQEK